MLSFPQYRPPMPNAFRLSMRRESSPTIQNIQCLDSSNPYSHLLLVGKEISSPWHRTLSNHEKNEELVYPLLSVWIYFSNLHISSNYRQSHHSRTLILGDTLRASYLRLSIIFRQEIWKASRSITEGAQLLLVFAVPYERVVNQRGLSSYPNKKWLQ